MPALLQPSFSTHRSLEHQINLRRYAPSEYHPVKAPWLDLTAGKFPYNWVRSSMVFDVDFYPEGVSEKLSFPLKRAGPLKNVGVQGFQLLVAERRAICTPR